MGGTLNKWLTLSLGIGAAALVLSKPKGVAAAASAVRSVVGGTTSDIIKSAGTGGS